MTARTRLILWPALRLVMAAVSLGLLALAIGCTTPVVPVRSVVARGHGAVVGGLIVVPRHVVGGDEAPQFEWGGEWREASVRLVDERWGSVDGLVHLDPWPVQFRPRGRSRRIRPGDSGTPLVAADGAVLGVLWGVSPGGFLVVIPLEPVR